MQRQWQSKRPTAVGIHLLAAVFVGMFVWQRLWPAVPALHAQAPTPAAHQRADVSPFLTRELAAASDPITFLVILREQPDPEAILQDAGVLHADRDTRLSLLYTALTTHARTTQASLRAWLDARAAPYRPYYIVNMLQVIGDAALVDELSQRSEVARIVADPRIAQSLAGAQPAAATHATVAPPSPELETYTSLPYGLTYTQALQVWQMGYRGAGIVVASQDTGVQWDHPALLHAYRGWSDVAGAADHVYNWYDAWDIDDPDDECTADAQIPCDDNGHGTHTVGTMIGDATGVGGAELGMAPDATWIGCRNMLNDFGTPASYTTCFEFMLAPYPQGGDPFTQGRPDLAPHVVNNSWACPPSEGCDVDSLRQVVETVRAAGIFVAASTGNYGDNCASVLHPIAIYDATFSVGAHDAWGNIASFSSRGPVTVDGSQRAKPDIAAPGVGVYSSWRDDGYTYLSGTSMASPHVAGAVALLWSAVPELIGDVDTTEQVLIKSAMPAPANECGEGTLPVSPNYTYGYGRLNAASAVSLAQSPATLTVTATSTVSGPLAGVEIRLVDSLTGSRQVATTDNFGVATFPRVYAGSYEVSASAVGFETPKALTVQRGEQIEMELTDELIYWLIFPYFPHEGAMGQ